MQERTRLQEKATNYKRSRQWQERTQLQEETLLLSRLEVRDRNFAHNNTQATHKKNKINRSVRIEFGVTASRMYTHKLLILKREDVVATHNTTPVK